MAETTTETQARVELRSGPQSAPRALTERFDLDGRVALITGGGGLLGFEHGSAIAELGGIPVLVDIDGARAEESANRIRACYDRPTLAVAADITSEASIQTALTTIHDELGTVDILINNAARNPCVSKDGLSGGLGDET